MKQTPGRQRPGVFVFHVTAMGDVDENGVFKATFGLQIGKRQHSSNKSLF